MGEAPDYDAHRRKCTPERVPPELPEDFEKNLQAQLDERPAAAQEKRDDAVLATALAKIDAGERLLCPAETQKLIEAGERMAEVVKGMNGLLEAIRGIAEDASNETKPIPHNDVAEILHALCDTLLVPVITFAETGKNG